MLRLPAAVSANAVLLYLFSCSYLFLYLFYVDAMSNRAAFWYRFLTSGWKNGTTPFLLTAPSLLGVQVAGMLIHVVQSSKQKAICSGKNNLNSSFMLLDSNIEGPSGDMSSMSFFYKVVLSQTKLYKL